MIEDLFQNGQTQKKRVIGSFSMDQDLFNRVKKHAYDDRMTQSKVIEDALTAYFLALDEQPAL